jgi:hypothetical protein
MIHTKHRTYDGNFMRMGGWDRDVIVFWKAEAGISPGTKCSQNNNAQ